jgi:hypothetical protein
MRAYEAHVPAKAAGQRCEVGRATRALSLDAGRAEDEHGAAKGERATATRCAGEQTRYQPSWKTMMTPL